MTTELTPDQIYAQYFDANGQPVRARVVLTDEEEREFAQYFPDTTHQTITEETHQ